MRMYANFAKVEPQEDGTLKVYGYASSGAEDSDGETVEPAAMKAAIPDYMKFGAVREMHQSIAAGTALEASVDDEGKTNFAAHIVDPIAVKKVTTGTYKGFSIGGKVLKRDAKNAKNITELRLVEVSLVDRPANPEAIFTMYKAEKTDEDAAAEEKAAVTAIAQLLNDKKIKPTQILKAATDSLAAPAKRAPIAYESFKKSMSTVSQFASMLQDCAWMASSAAYEAEYEGDGSKVPEQLRAWIADGIKVFEGMAAEETAELLASIKPPAATEVAVIASADTIADVAKAGSKFSADTKEKLGDIHKAMQAHADGMKECCAKMDSLGYKNAEDDADGKDDDVKAAAKAAPVAEIPNTATTAEDAFKAEQAKDAARAAATTGATGATVNKAEEAYQAELAKDAVTAELAKRDSIIDALSKRLAAIEAQPMPGAVFLKAITKGEDVGGSSVSASANTIEIPANATPEQIAKAQIIHQFRTGGRLVGG